MTFQNLMFCYGENHDHLAWGHTALLEVQLYMCNTSEKDKICSSENKRKGQKLIQGKKNEKKGKEIICRLSEIKL